MRRRVGVLERTNVHLHCSWSNGLQQVDQSTSHMTAKKTLLQPLRSSFSNAGGDPPPTHAHARSFILDHGRRRRVMNGGGAAPGSPCTAPRLERPGGMTTVGGAGDYDDDENDEDEDAGAGRESRGHPTRHRSLDPRRNEPEGLALAGRETWLGCLERLTRQTRPTRHRPWRAHVLRHASSFWGTAPNRR